MAPRQLQPLVLLAATAALLSMGFRPPADSLDGPRPDTLHLDTASLASGPHAHMEGLLERTIFQVDVLTLSLRVGPRTARQLRALATHADYSEALADSAAAVMIRARDVYARMSFQRDASLEQLLDGIRDNLDRALNAGIIGSHEYASVADSLGRWYEPLRGRGVREGDAMLYRIRGDSLQVVYRTEDGRVLLDQLRVGPAHRLSVLGGYFAPGADLRGDLLRSLFREGGGDG